ncbi:MAG: SIS domain-containing protein [Cytophagales bacterium]|nr:SIS domain-containing protein [Cytophagales bacterium]
MNPQNKIAELIQQEIAALQNIPLGPELHETVELIHQQVHKMNAKLVFSGMGKAGQVGSNIATTLSSTGTPSIFLHPSEAQHGDLGILQPNDVLFLVSNSGKTTEILLLVQLAKSLYPEVKIICMTGHPDSPLSEKADITLFTGNPNEICPLGLTPTTSTTVMGVIGDMLVVMLMEKINFTVKDYAQRHHSGYLGEKSRNHE